MGYFYYKGRGTNSGLKRQQKVEKLQGLFDQFLLRMQSQSFHGGEGPDAVDFKVNY